MVKLCLLLHVLCFFTASGWSNGLIVPKGTKLILKPPSSMTWWKSAGGSDDELVHFDKDEAHVDNQGRLHLHLTNTSMSGKYKLKIYDSRRNEEWTEPLPPPIKIDDDNHIDYNIVIQPGEEYVLNCSLPGTQTKWVKDGAYMHNAQRQLNISNARQDQSGIYMCFDNNIGQEFKVDVKHTGPGLVELVNKQTCTSIVSSVFLGMFIMSICCVLPWLWAIEKYRSKGNDMQYKSHVAEHAETQGTELTRDILPPNSLEQRLLNQEGAACIEEIADDGSYILLNNVQFTPASRAGDMSECVIRQEILGTRVALQYPLHHDCWFMKGCKVKLCHGEGENIHNWIGNNNDPGVCHIGLGRWLGETDLKRQSEIHGPEILTLVTKLMKDNEEIALHNRRLSD